MTHWRRLAAVVGILIGANFGSLTESGAQTAPLTAFYAMVGGAKGLVIIGQSKNRITSKIVGKKEITSVEQLKGKRLGIDRIGSNPDMFAQAALSRFQIDTLKDLQYVQLGAKAAETNERPDRAH